MPILQAARAALPQSLTLGKHVVCKAFADRWKCDLHLKSKSIRSASKSILCRLPMKKTPERVVELMIMLLVEHRIACAIPADSYQAGKICHGYYNTLT
jgi:hypothetical protein